MRRIVSLSFALLFAPVILVAQNSATTDTNDAARAAQTAALQARVMNMKSLQKARMQSRQMCEVGLQASMGAGGGQTLYASSSDKKIASGQRILVSMKNPNSLDIAKARFSVRGLPASDKGHFVPADADAAAITKWVDFDLSVASMKDASANLWMDGFFSVSRVELVSVTLADGSTHNYSGCRVDISPKMLVGAR